ncbi:VTC domain-containing protein [Archangium lansingense]|uniref:VTC domain-containing protein n=1 Tax=Archangium lansingense TaxID=2995310 RepID=A0ABT4AJ60_9BACT|nr:VTC domain-containing protein [Archangium lansinium]MCY1081738.1 VTC domain-containing protein [Archangium lansinium]
MNAPARMSPPPMSAPAPELDHERRFQPSREALETFLRDTRQWTTPCVYDTGLPISFTRTTYFDTERLDFLGSCRAGRPQRLRLREYAGTVNLSCPPMLTGMRFLEMKTSSGQRRTKIRASLSADEAGALLTGAPLPKESAAATLLRQAAPAPVKPWVTAWYRRHTYATEDASVRITVDEELLFALPPERSAMNEPATPSRLLHRAPASLLEVKWRGSSPPWLEWLLWTLEPFETRGSKFEQGMRARLASTPSTQ